MGESHNESKKPEEKYNRFTILQKFTTVYVNENK